MNLLEDIIVLDFSQYLAGPSGALRLADLGARVIKVERPNVGDGSRKLCLKNLKIDGDSLLFHTINRNKESIELDLKSEKDIEIVKKLIKKADVLIENNRPGVMNKLGLDFESVKKINDKLVYASITGYGTKGIWSKKPGQDLLLQSMSGITFLNGNKDQDPTPFGLSIADSFTGMHAVQGILACLFRRFKTGKGGKVEVSLLESVLQIQFEVLTTFLNDGYKKPKRAENNAHAYLASPYGIYETKDGFITIAMGNISVLNEVLKNPKIEKYTKEDLYEKRDEINKLIANIIKNKTTKEWIFALEEKKYWCSEVFDWETLIKEEGFKSLDMLMTLERNNQKFQTTCCPIKVNGKRLKSEKVAPILGFDTEKIIREIEN